MFIVVAIVVFGIFVGLAYTVFGSEGVLTNDLETLFEDSFSKTEDKFHNIEPKEVINLTDSELSENTIKTSDLIYRHGAVLDLLTEDYAIFNAKKDDLYAGAVIPYNLTGQGTYLFEYELTLLEGSLSTIGGHSNFLYNRFYINEESKESYYIGTDYTYAVGETIKVQVVLSNHIGTHPTKELYIQPNRNKYNSDFKVKIENISLRKVLEK